MSKKDFVISKDGKTLIRYIGNEENVIIPDGIEIIGCDAFAYSYIESVVISSSVKSIFDGAFEGCRYLKSIVIPNSVVYLGKSTFNKCICLKEVKLSNSLTSIEYGTFSYCNGLKSIEIPDSVEKIESYAFDNCTRLSSIKISENIKTIKSYAFSNCFDLENINIPDSLIDADDCAFAHCNNLKYNKYDNAYYLGNKDNSYLILVKVVNDKIKSCNIHKDTRFIMNGAFECCCNLTEITIPENVIKIGSFAFAYCNDLMSVKLSSKITQLSGYLFNGCGNLENVTISDDTNIIQSAVFSNCYKLVREGKFKAFNIREDSLYCIGKRYEENKWHYVKGELWLCRNGIHYVDNLYAIFDYYSGKIDKDIVIYEIETRGEDIKDLDSSKHCCRSLRLKRRIYREELIKMLNGDI